MTSAPRSGGGDPPGTEPAGGRSGRDKLERRLRALTVELDGLAVTEGQREVMEALHGGVVVRMLRQAARPVTIHDVAARTGLPVYTAEAALDWLREEKAAERDTTGPVWPYTAVARPAEPTAGSPAEPAAGDPTDPVPGGSADVGGAVSPAGALVAALAARGWPGQVNGHAVMVAVAGGPGLRVVSAQSAEGGWAWSWRYDGPEYRHPRTDAAGAAGKLCASRLRPPFTRRVARGRVRRPV